MFPCRKRPLCHIVPGRRSRVASDSISGWGPSSISSRLNKSRSIAGGTKDTTLLFMELGIERTMKVMIRFSLLGIGGGMLSCLWECRHQQQLPLQSVWKVLCCCTSTLVSRYTWVLRLLISALIFKSLEQRTGKKNCGRCPSASTLKWL